MRRLFLAVLLFLSLTDIGVAAQEERVNINQADASTLDRVLKGIGPAKAEAIVTYRKEHGPFKQAEDLLNVTGIGPKLVEQNRALLRF